MGITKYIGVNWRNRNYSRIYTCDKSEDKRERINEEAKTEVRQRSPALYNIYGERLGNECLEWVCDFKVGRSVNKTIRYADDFKVIVQTQGELKRMLDHGYRKRIWNCNQRSKVRKTRKF